MGAPADKREIVRARRQSRGNCSRRLSSFSAPRIILSRRRNHALDAIDIPFKKNSADGDLQYICVQRKWRLEVVVRELQSCAQTALYIIKTFNVRWYTVHKFCARARGSQVVERRFQRGLLVDELVVEVQKSKNRL